MQDATNGSARAPLLDPAHLDRQTAGDAALKAELLALFADQCRRLLPALEDASRPRTERADAAHTLKGSALGIGAARVAERADAVESALRAARGDGAAAITALAEDIAATLARIGRA